MWTALITKVFIIQLLNLDRDRRDYVLNSVQYLWDILNPDARPKFDIIDEYDDKPIDTRFPLYYRIDHDKELVYLIGIDESYRQPHSTGSV